MKTWYSRSNDIELKDGSIKKEYHIVFDTDSKEIKDKVERFFQKIMDGND